MSGQSSIISLNPEERAFKKKLGLNATVQEVYEIASEVAHHHAFQAVGPMSIVWRELADKVAYIEDTIGIDQAAFDVWLEKKRAEDAAREAAEQARPLPVEGAGGDIE